MKFKLTEETKIINDSFGVEHTLHRIQSLVDIPEIGVWAGDIGGWVEKESNLSQDGEAWVAGNAIVWDNAIVRDNAYVRDNAIVCGSASVEDDGYVADNALVRDNAYIEGNSQVYGYALVGDSATVTDSASVSGEATVGGTAVIHGCASIFGYAEVGGNTEIGGTAKIYATAVIENNSDTLAISGIENCEQCYSRDYIPNERALTFFKTRDGIMSSWGVPLKSFREYINQHYTDEKIKKQYFLIAKLAEYHFCDNKE